MAYHRAYHKETTRYLARHPGVKTNVEVFASKGSARAAITREAKRGVINADDFDVADVDTFYLEIEKSVEVENILTKQKVTQRVNTPWCCNPASETYHQM